ncbi:hypothetical protein [Longimicrobium sp.]|jgi:hypothetical protein|uniref:hypothetical protein n=1 Tax=Longimicrobium sp. TaxID=2029185 RepID=UPI002F92B9C8
MTRYFAFPLLLLISSTLPLSAGAQEMARALDAVPQNSVVRLRGPELRPRRIQGRIGEVVGDTVIVLRGSRKVAVPIAGIAQAEVATDRDPVRGMLHGARIGAGVGAVLGSVVMTAACYSCSGSDRVEVAAAGLVAGAIFFAIPTGLMGLAVGGESWEPVGPAAPRVGLVQAGDGRMGIGVSLATP